MQAQKKNKRREMRNKLQAADPSFCRVNLCCLPPIAPLTSRMRFLSTEIYHHRLAVRRGWAKSFMRRTCGRALYQLSFIPLWGLGGFMQWRRHSEWQQSKSSWGEKPSEVQTEAGKRVQGGDLVGEMKAWLMFPWRFHSSQIPTGIGRERKSYYHLKKEKRRWS